MALDPTFKKRWVAALRSGEYDQGQSKLCRLTPEGAKYCCLGVAYELEHGEDGWVKYPDACGWLHTAEGHPGLWTPPGLARESTVCLATLNDAGKTFDEIADYIEENL